jgi:predicted Zn-ribbon and HTH transcriptional regulator
MISKRLHCNQCGGDWEPRVVMPIQCPRCHRLDWMGPKKYYPINRPAKVGKVQ